jgi:serine/threonine protein kinase/CheY-like chemotaxis protein
MARFDSSLARPLARFGAASAGADMTRAAAASATTGSSSSTPPKRRVLVVEDDGIVATDIAGALIKFGYLPAGRASSGQEAVRKAEELRPDLILMDVRLRGAMDGISAAEVVRDRFGIPIVFLTASSDLTTMQRALQVTPNGYLVKPFRDVELRAMLDITLRREEESLFLPARMREPANDRAAHDPVRAVSPELDHDPLFTALDDAKLSYERSRAPRLVREPERQVRPPKHESLPNIQPVCGRFGGYELACRLASGGMGTVWVATRPHPEGVSRTVALKTLHAHLAADDHFVRTFLDEARAIARINHPYVCRLSDVGSASMPTGVPLGSDGLTPYIAMEYLVGEPLSRVVRRNREATSEFDTACIVRMVAMLCEGLHAAHEVRDESGRPLALVHRDISPDNLFVLYDGSVRVVDFGIARSSEDTRMASSIEPQGKLAYMSPEQVRGEQLTRSSDLWSMGVVLWELLAGRGLISHQSPVRAMEEILEQPVPAPSRYNPHVPEALDQIVGKLLKLHPRERYASALELARALERFSVVSYGAISNATLGAWLEAMFPGGKRFREQVIPNARRLLEGAGLGDTQADALFGAQSEASAPSDSIRTRDGALRPSLRAKLRAASSLPSRVDSRNLFDFPGEREDHAEPDTHDDAPHADLGPWILVIAITLLCSTAVLWILWSTGR